MYPNLVKKFYAHFIIEKDFVSSIVYRTIVMVNPEILAKEFVMDASPPKLNSFFLMISL